MNLRAPHKLWARRLGTASAGTAALLMVTGIAYAAWSSAGAGAGTAAAGTTSALGVVASVDSQLYPTASADLTVLVSNPNARPVTVTSLTVTGSITASSGCTTPGVTVTLPASVMLTVPAGGSAPVTIPDAVAMSAASSSNCQGATFTIPLSATGRTT